MKFTKVTIGKAEVYHARCEDILRNLESEKVDSVITDPPYLYLKHKLDIPFDEEIVFSNWHRVLKNNSMIAFFGRGDAFYRWNILLNGLGFKFKEGAVWDKNNASNFLSNFMRVHEDISFRSKGSQKINKCHIDYFEYLLNKNKIDSIEDIFKRLKSALNSKDKDEVIKYIDFGLLEFNHKSKSKYNLTAADINKTSRNVGIFKTVIQGKIETSILRCKKEQLKYEHPTQKPVDLMRRIINLCTKENDIVLDPFMGGGSTGVACVHTNRKFIGIEIDKEYFDTACRRIENAYNEMEKEAA